MGNSVNPFSDSTYSGGGSYSLTARVDTARFQEYDFNGKANNGNAVVLFVGLQPVDDDGDNNGDATERRYIIGNASELSIENGGKTVTFTGSRNTIWNLCDFAVFRASLKECGYDYSSLEAANDISLLEGCVFEFGLKADPKNERKKEGKKDQSLLVPTHYVGTASKKATKGTKSSASKETKDTKAVAAAAPASSGSGEAEDVLTSYMSEKILIDKNAKGIDKLQARMQLAKYIDAKGGDADLKKAASALFNDAGFMSQLLDAADWKLEGSTLLPK